MIGLRSPRRRSLRVSSLADSLGIFERLMTLLLISLFILTSHLVIFTDILQELGL